MIAGMYAAYGTATGALEAALGVLEGIKQAARLAPIEMDPRVSGLYAAYGERPPRSRPPAPSWRGSRTS
jgi:hypothetical protein